MHDDSIKLRLFCPNCFHYLSRSLLFSFMGEVEQSFHINCGWGIFLPVMEMTVKLNESTLLHFLSYCSS